MRCTVPVVCLVSGYIQDPHTDLRPVTHPCVPLHPETHSFSSTYEVEIFSAGYALWRSLDSFRVAFLRFNETAPFIYCRTVSRHRDDEVFEAGIQ